MRILPLAAPSPSPFFPRFLLAAAYFAILRCLSLYSPACPPVSAPGMKCARHFAWQDSRAERTSARRYTAGFSVRQGAARRGAAQRLLLSLSFGNSQLTHFSLVRRPSPFASLPTYACSLEFAGMRVHIDVPAAGRLRPKSS